jgi:hypothetical protein
MGLTNRVQKLLNKKARTKDISDDLHNVFLM